MEEQHIYLHALRSLPSMSDRALRKILAAFNTVAKEAWYSTTLPKDLTLGPVLKNVWPERHALIPQPFQTALLLEEQAIRIITEANETYPKLLLETSDHPLFLYVRGRMELNHPAPMLAVVGSRKFTGYGKQVCEALVRDLTNAGITIVSGLAFGIDKIAHQTALTNGGHTLAVLGSGVDDAGISPTSHKKLGQEILLAGALVSEFPPNTVPDARNFPMRNRIIAGMTLGTLVIEAAEKSGSLITARLALDYNREVFAVPGSIFSSASSGTNKILKQGALMVTNAKDILDILLPRTLFARTEDTAGTQPKLTLPNLSPAEQKLLALLQHESLHINTLVKNSGLTIAETGAALMLLEIKKHSKHIGNQTYIAL